MRIFLSVLILIFTIQSWTKADDIKDFEIEGMSINKSALNFMTVDEIINNTFLSLPHPFLHKRNFVLFPLAQIAANFVHPVFNKNINDSSSMRSAHLAPESPFKWFLKDKNSFFQPITGDFSADILNQPRQSFEDVYVPNGYIDIIKSSTNCSSRSSSNWAIDRPLASSSIPLISSFFKTVLNWGFSFIVSHQPEIPGPK